MFVIDIPFFLSISLINKSNDPNIIGHTLIFMH